MIVEVKVPQLSESVAEATLLDWHKKEGEGLARREPDRHRDSTRSSSSCPSPADGVLVES